MSSSKFSQLSLLCLVLGFLSIGGSIAIWYMTGGKSVELQTHGKRFGVFVGP